MNEILTPLDRLKAIFSGFELKTEEERTQILAVEAAKESPEMICDKFWMPLALLYEQMLKKGEITRIEMIGRDKALLYWTQACVTNREKPKWVRIMIMRALYMADLIKENI